MMLERVMERHKRANGAIVEIYLKKRSRRIYTCRVTFPNETFVEQGGFAAMPPAMEWGIVQADAKGRKP